ncbi:type II secretion system protein [Candidatus Gracilibacteria bacterium]|nr:MAG: type II secretion system protein [Candidatus Gracilibacteria bacterium]
MCKKNKNAFSLIELVVVIGLITFIALTATSLNFQGLSDKQKLEIFSNRIITQIEAIRNDALVGKNLYDTTKKIGFEDIEQWEIAINKTTATLEVTAYPRQKDISEVKEPRIVTTNKASVGEKIEALKCNGVGGEKSIDSAKIVFEGTKTAKVIGEDCNENSILQFELSYSKEKGIIEFDPVSGLVEIKKEKAKP